MSKKRRKRSENKIDTPDTLSGRFTTYEVPQPKCDFRRIFFSDEDSDKTFDRDSFQKREPKKFDPKEDAWCLFSCSRL